MTRTRCALAHVARDRHERARLLAAALAWLAGLVLLVAGASCLSVLVVLLAGAVAHVAIRPASNQTKQAAPYPAKHRRVVV